MAVRANNNNPTKFHIPIALLLIMGVGGLALFSLNRMKGGGHKHPSEVDITIEEDLLGPIGGHHGDHHPPPIPSTHANNINHFDFHGIEVPNDKYNFGNDFDPITVPNFKRKSGTLYRMGWIVPNFEDVPTYDVSQESKTPFVPSYRHHLKNQPMLSRVANDSYSIFNDDKRGDGFSSFNTRINSFNTSSVGGRPVGPSALVSYGPTGVGSAVGGSTNVGGGPSDPYSSTASVPGFGTGGQQQDMGGMLGPQAPIPINPFQQQNQFSEFAPGGPQPVNSTDPVFDAAVADTDSIPQIVVNPGNPITPHIIGIKNQVLKMIIANTTSVNTILSNIDTIKQAIEQYGHKLYQAFQQSQIGNISPVQYNQFVLQVVSEVANSLQLPLNPTFAAQLNASPYQPVSPIM